jgi:hypothetical protein
MAIKRQRDAIDYARQQKLLNEIHETEKIDIFVASHKIYEPKNGTRYSVWTNGIDSSLPQTEKIAFLMDSEGADHFIVPWEAAAGVIGNLPEREADLIPVRYRVRDFPSAEQIVKLRQLAG